MIVKSDLISTRSHSSTLGHLRLGRVIAEKSRAAERRCLVAIHNFRPIYRPLKYQWRSNVKARHGRKVRQISVVLPEFSKEVSLLGKPSLRTFKVGRESCLGLELHERMWTYWIRILSSCVDTDRGDHSRSVDSLVLRSGMLMVFDFLLPPNGICLLPGLRFKLGAMANPNWDDFFYNFFYSHQASGKLDMRIVYRKMRHRQVCAHCDRYLLTFL